MKETNALFRKISVQVQLDSIAIPTSNYSQTVRHCWFVVSFTHVRTTNAKLFKSLLERVVKKEIARKSKCLGTARQYCYSNLQLYSQTVRHCWFVVSFTSCAYNKRKTVQILVGRRGKEGNCKKNTVQVQLRQYRYSNLLYSQTVKHCQFVVSFTHVRTTNAKLFKPLSEGVVKKEIERKISVQVQLDSTAIPTSNVQSNCQALLVCRFVYSCAYNKCKSIQTLVGRGGNEGKGKKNKCLGTARQYRYSNLQLQSNCQALLVCRFVYSCAYNKCKTVQTLVGNCKKLLFRYSQIVSLFQPASIVKLLGIVGLSFRLLMCIQQTQNYSKTCRKAW